MINKFIFSSEGKKRGLGFAHEELDCSVNVSYRDIDLKQIHVHVVV